MSQGRAVAHTSPAVGLLGRAGWTRSPLPQAQARSVSLQKPTWLWFFTQFCSKASGNAVLWLILSHFPLLSEQQSCQACGSWWFCPKSPRTTAPRRVVIHLLLPFPTASHLMLTCSSLLLEGATALTKKRKKSPQTLTKFIHCF